jgi:hypothetical protein
MTSHYDQPELSMPDQITMNALEFETRKRQVLFMLQWCIFNYDRGASTMVECWGEGEFNDLFVAYKAHGDANPVQHHSFAEAFETLRNVAGAYRDQEADAAFHRSQAC